MRILWTDWAYNPFYFRNRAHQSIQAYLISWHLLECYINRMRVTEKCAPNHYDNVDLENTLVLLHFSVDVDPLTPKIRNRIRKYGRSSQRGGTNFSRTCQGEDKSVTKNAYIADEINRELERRAKYPLEEHCQSCGKKDGKMYRHPDRTMVMTICQHEWEYLRRNGRLDPNPRANYPIQDHCESCGTRDGILLRHPDPTTIMTICKREWSHFRR